MPFPKADEKREEERE
ncbi:hypothetical protein NPIL_474461, partial [Nephila pilipes]